MNRNTERIQENLDEMRQIQENVLESRGECMHKIF